MSKIIRTYQNAKNETILVYESGAKIRQSLAEKRVIEDKENRIKRSLSN